jgi:hypothetical protein
VETRIAYSGSSYFRHEFRFVSEKKNDQIELISKDHEQDNV